jgi:prepilin signal peptidase PulO-like enzyme (type II secretory pathway)
VNSAVLVLALVLGAAPPAARLARRVVVVWLGARAPSAWALAAGFLLLFAWAALTRPPLPVLAVSLGFGWVLVCLAVIDLGLFRLPDPLTLPLAAAGLALAWFLPGRPLADHLAAAAVAWGGLTLVGLAFRKARGVEGIGPGDAKLLAAAGAWLGSRALPSVILIACAVAFVWIGVRALARGRAVLADRIAFGAPLALAIWIVWLHGPLSI